MTAASTVPAPAAPSVCPECAGARVVAVHVCGSYRHEGRNQEECRRRCPRLERCMACADQPVPTLAAVADLYQRLADIGREQHWSAGTIEDAQAAANHYRQLAKGEA